jgi:glutamyl-tRNA reductase
VHLLTVGVHYASAPLHIREQLSIPAHDLEQALHHLRPRVREGLILSTCNRTEVYAVIDRGASDAGLHDFLAERGGLSSAEVRRWARVRRERVAVEHALRVAAGLDSMVLGEDQVQAQMKRALATARQVSALGPTLERLGAAALTCGKRVRTLTGIGRHTVSIESLAVRAAERHTDVAEADVLVIGAGDSAALITRHLSNAGARRVTVVSRVRERSEALSRTAGFRSRAFAELADALADADVVFCCTSAPHPILTTEGLAHRLARRSGAPLLCMDLGMPRDVDADVAALPGVGVVTLDELAGVAAAHRAEREAEVPRAEAIVATETARFLDWMVARAARGAAPLRQAAHG